MKQKHTDKVQTTTPQRQTVRKTAEQQREQKQEPSGLSIGATINISASSFDKRRKNKAGEREYAEKHGTDIDANEMTTKLIRKDYIKRITSHVAKTREGIKHYSSPWDDGGNRRVAPLMIPKMQEYITKRRMGWQEKVDAFLDKWPEIRRNSEKRLNGDFAKYAHLYPAEDDRDGVLRNFNLSITFGPLGGAEDLPHDLREMWEEEDERRRAEISQDLRNRFYDKLTHLSKRCAVAGDEGTAFRKSNLEKVVELCDILPSMMIDGDMKLQGAIDQARHMLRGIDSDSIKSSKIVATDISQQAKEIANSLM
mgnify:FL=1